MNSSSTSETKQSPEHKPKLVVIVGPTASGKSDLGIFLAQKLKGEIISADSRQVYQGMDIGSGKVSKREQKLVPHHLLDVVPPKREFTVEDYQRNAKRALKRILRKKNIPIVVGGTGFYVDAFVFDTQFPSVPPNHKLRKELEKFSVQELFTKLRKKDPLRARSIDADNKVRLIRALEIILALGKVPKIKKESPYDVLWIGITLPKRKLDHRIEKRLDQRLKIGMVPEVKKLLKNGVSYDRLYRLGLEYRWVSQYLYLGGQQTQEQMRAGLLKAITQYAKRQMTWFKRNKDIRWVKTKSQALSLARGFLKN
jgi:tRNA dimethylallyltransferase